MKTDLPVAATGTYTVKASELHAQLGSDKPLETWLRSMQGRFYLKRGKAFLPLPDESVDCLLSDEAVEKIRDYEQNKNKPGKELSTPFSPLPGGLISASMHQIGGKNVLAMSARELHAALEMGRDFTNWTKTQIQRYNLVQDVDYAIYATNGVNASAGRPAAEYHFTMETGRRVLFGHQGRHRDTILSYLSGIEASFHAQSLASINVSATPKFLRPIVTAITRGFAAIFARLDALDRRVDNLPSAPAIPAPAIPVTPALPVVNRPLDETPAHQAIAEAQEAVTRMRTPSFMRGIETPLKPDSTTVSVPGVVSFGDATRRLNDESRPLQESQIVRTWYEEGGGRIPTQASTDCCRAIGFSNPHKLYQWLLKKKYVTVSDRPGDGVEYEAARSQINLGRMRMKSTELKNNTTNRTVRFTSIGIKAYAKELKLELEAEKNSHNPGASGATPVPPLLKAQATLFEPLDGDSGDDRPKS